MSNNFLDEVMKVKIVKNNENSSKEVLSDMKNVTDLNKLPPLNHREVDEDRKSKNTFPALWVVAFISLIFLFFAISYLFTGLKINIYPEVQYFDLKANLNAVKNSNINLSFDLISLAGQESKKIENITEEDFLETAVGKVVIYNAFSANKQNLLIDTRLEGSNNKIYKTKKAVSVPGMQKDKPGSVEVEIYANEPGEEYNSEPIDFKILGFKGTNKYDKFYARSVDSITGGLKGKHQKIDAEEKLLIKEELSQKLKEKLYQKVNDQIPDGFILYPEAVFLDIQEEKIIKNEEDNSFLYTLEASLNGFLFNEDKLTKKLVENYIQENLEIEGDVFINNFKDLTFSFNQNLNSISLNDIKEINFNLFGSAEIVWRLNKADFINQILGKNKKDFNFILEKYPGIESATWAIKPAWKKYFPEQEKDIKINIHYPQ